jgi:hypothetical protein
MSIALQQPAEAQYSWVHFVAASGAEGQRWAEQYRDEEIQALIRDIDRSLVLLRQGQLEAGRALLDEVSDRRERMPQISMSIRYVLARRSHGLLAYHLYCREDYAAAERELLAAHDAVAQAISHDPFLLPLAGNCPEFRLHRARIARNQRRWAEMQQHIDVVLAMAEDRSPLCQLADGTHVRYSTLVQYYDRLPQMSEDERRDVADQCDPERRYRMFLRDVHSVYILPGFVVPLP